MAGFDGIAKTVPIRQDVKPSGMHAACATFERTPVVGVEYSTSPRAYVRVWSYTL